MSKTIRGVVNRSHLAAGFRELGINPSSFIMVHASLSALGVVEGGPDAVVVSLREAAGPEGAVIIPSFRDSIRADYYGLRECRKVCPQTLCPSPERGYTGIVGETVREQPDSIRSCHPTHSWVGVGGGASFLLEGHGLSLTPCGTDSPFFRLMERDGVILLIGVGVNALTNMHAVEDARNVPYLSAVDPPNRHATYTTSGRRMQYVYPELLMAAFREAGIIRSTRIGSSLCHAIGARTLGAFLWTATEDDPWWPVLRPRGSTYEPFDDACRKAARMVRAWNVKDSSGAWEALMDESRKPREPVLFEPTTEPAVACPAYRGEARGYHRCGANDLPPWERFQDYPTGEPGVATCGQCDWPEKQEGRR